MKPFVAIMSASLAAAVLSAGAWAGDARRLEPAWVGVAKSSADHEAIAKAHEAQALGFEKKAAMHSNLAETYGAAGGIPWQASQVKNCDSVAVGLNAAAQEDRALPA